MRKTSKKRAPGGKKAATKTAKSKSARKTARRGPVPVKRPRTTPEPLQPPAAEDEAAYIETVIQSGEAARLDKHGKLPAGATHKIVEDEAGTVKVVRRRFSMT